MEAGLTDQRRGKMTVSDLAIFGGSPMFDDELHVGRPNILDRAGTLSRINDAIDRLWLTNDGPLVRELEERFAEFAGVEHAIAVANATLGLQLTAMALDLNGDVVMPSFTFIGTAHAMKSIGLRPVFCDVLPRTHLLDPAAVEAASRPLTSAILEVPRTSCLGQLDHVPATGHAAEFLASLIAS
jgi:dTDP-4-amino-4,6-dideoxy-D-glucose transaminase